MIMSDKIQKIISAAGLMSRRAAEEAIKAGRVRCNGELASLGDRADPDKDRIELDGKAVFVKERHVYLMLHKPRGVVTTTSDEKGRKTAADLVADLGLRVYPVGRLDLDSEGLLLMTNDGEFTNRLTHPAHEVEKVYHVYVKGSDIDGALVRLGEPMSVDGKPIRPAQVKLLHRIDAENAVVSVCIHEGKNRQVRKMCDQVGLSVSRLIRVSEGGVMLGDLPKGKWRFLTEEEINLLK